MLRLFITLPFLVALVVFAIYNQEIVTISMPGGYSRQTSPAVLVMVVAVVFFLVGAVAVWFAELRQRRRARRAEQSVRGLEAQLAELRLQLAQAAAQAAAQAHPIRQGAGPAQTYVLQPPPPPSVV